MIMANSDEEKLDHPTQKPVLLFQTPIGTISDQAARSMGCSRRCDCRGGRNPATIGPTSANLIGDLLDRHSEIDLLIGHEAGTTDSPARLFHSLDRQPTRA